MELFGKIIPPLLSFVENQPRRRTWRDTDARAWPRGGPRSLVLKEDTGLELGNPEKDSLSCLLWTGDLSMVSDGRITLVGPDFPESAGGSLPFGKVVLAGVEGFDADNAYDRHKELDFLRYDLDLEGFMMRAVSQYLREWCRISRNALGQGFSARVMGSALMALFRGVPYVKAVEVIMFTTDKADVETLREITSPVEKLVGAMNKMAADMDFECGDCEYQDVCDEADGLRSMRDRLREKQESMHG
jgi:CO dehydrogenase/acetyl-CoA synthase beta subunit